MLNHEESDRRTDWDHPFITLIEPLSSGAMGDVWRGYHHGLGTYVAIKFLSDEMVDRGDVRERFRNEARFAARVDERHVVRHYDFAETANGHPFIVMECLRGVALYDMLLARGRLAPIQVALVLDQLAAAVDAIHQVGVIHRDIKPENIVLVPGRSELTVKLIDFGVAVDMESASSRLTLPGVLVGTPSYLSPEQIELGHSTKRSDLWALGVIAYELLTGELPFQALSVRGICLAVCLRTCERPSVRVPSLGPAIDAWFARATAADPAQRFATAKEMAIAFRRAAKRSHAGRVVALPLVRRAATSRSRSEETATLASLTMPNRPTTGIRHVTVMGAAAVLISGAMALAWLRGGELTPELLRSSQQASSGLATTAAQIAAEHLVPVCDGTDVRCVVAGP